MVSQYRIPEMNRNCFERKQLYQLLDRSIRQFKITYLYCYIGTGKTITVASWLKARKNQEETVFWLDGKDLNIENELMTLHELVSQEPRGIVVLDSIEELVEKDKIELIVELVKRSKKNTRFVLVSRGMLPAQFLNSFLNQEINIIRPNQALFSVDESIRYIEQYGGRKFEYIDIAEEDVLFRLPVMLDIALSNSQDPLNMDMETKQFTVSEMKDYLVRELKRQFDMSTIKAILVIASFDAMPETLLETLFSQNQVQKIDQVIAKNCILFKDVNHQYLIKKEVKHQMLSFLHDYLDKEKMKEYYVVAGTYYENRLNYDQALKYYEMAKDYRSMVKVISKSIAPEPYVLNIRELKVKYKEHIKKIPDRYIKQDSKLAFALALISGFFYEFSDLMRYYEMLCTIYKENGYEESDRDELLMMKLTIELVFPVRKDELVMMDVVDPDRIYSFQIMIQYFVHNPYMLASASRSLVGCIEYANTLPGKYQNHILQMVGDSCSGILDIYMGMDFYFRNNIDQALIFVNRGRTRCHQDGILFGELLAKYVEFYAMIAKKQLYSIDESIDSVDQIYHEYNAVNKGCQISSLCMVKALYENETEVIDDWWNQRGDSYENPYDILKFDDCVLKAKVCILKHQYFQGLSILQPLFNYCQYYVWNNSTLALYTIQAMIHYQVRDYDAALKEIEEALKLAELTHNIRGIANEGAGCVELMKEYIKKKRLNRKKDEFVFEVFDAIVEMANAYPQYLNIKKELKENLTKAEMQMLKQLATNRSNMEIAQQLCISLNTVKHHTKNIYQKLDVNSRQKAVYCARELGLI
ncbi:transcriptional activator of maltose regulon, MalT [Lachnospiraceae bacterium KM106-2]|nr:transcriptional activator of maltose regulon, MalT [Lachnospiraceae bacterium KM106-2]